MRSASADRIGRGTGRQDDGELLAADPADDVGSANSQLEHVGEDLEDLVALSVPADVVHALEVVDVEHHQRDLLSRPAGALELGAEPLVEVAVVVEPGQRVGVRKVLEPGADLCVVERERGRVAEPAGELELVLVERRVLAHAVDVQRALQRAAGDQRHADQRLRVGRRAGDERDPWIEMGFVGQDRAAVLDRPAGDPLAVLDRARQHLLGPPAAGKHGHELSPLLVGLVDVEILVRDEVAERVGDPVEERVEALLGQDLVEDGREAAVRLDERLRARRVGSLRIGIRQKRNLDCHSSSHIGTMGRPSCPYWGIRRCLSGTGRRPAA